MKIAIQIFGHMRTFKRCYPYLQKYLLGCYDCDIYIHTWDTINHSTKTWHKNTGNSFKKIIAKDDIELVFNKKKQLKKVLIEKQSSKDMGEVLASNKAISIRGIVSMYLSMYKVNKLREEYAQEHGISYDYVIMLRADILIKKLVSIEEIVSGLSDEVLDNSVFTAGFTNQERFNDLNQMGATDILFFSRPSIMSDIFSIEDAIVADLYPNMIIPHPVESLFLQRIATLRYELFLFSYNKYCKIIRCISKKNVKKQFLKVRRYGLVFKIRFFSLILVPILHIRLRVFRFELDVSVGDVDD